MGRIFEQDVRRRDFFFSMRSARTQPFVSHALLMRLVFSKEIHSQASSFGTEIAPEQPLFHYSLGAFDFG